MEHILYIFLYIVYIFSYHIFYIYISYNLIILISKVVQRERENRGAASFLAKHLRHWDSNPTIAVVNPENPKHSHLQGKCHQVILRYTLRGCTSGSLGTFFGFEQTGFVHLVVLTSCTFVCSKTKRLIICFDSFKRELPQNGPFARIKATGN